MYQVNVGEGQQSTFTSHEKVIASVDPGGGGQINSQCREGQQSM